MSESKTVLIIEDDPEIRFVFRELLENEGFQVEEAVHGKAAMSLMDNGLRPHLILLDLNMPVMDGTEFLKTRSQSPDLLAIPVIVISASVSETKPNGATAFLKKPPDLENVLYLVERHCL